MGIFRKAGEKFEEAKRSLMEKEEIEFVCQECGEPVTQEYEACPHCGEDAIERVA